MDHQPDVDWLLQVIRTAANRANYTNRHGTVQVTWKPDNTPVTNIDTSVEAWLIGKILGRHPKDGIWAEETGRQDGISGWTWIIDPIDGTQALGKYPTSTICVARCDPDGQPEHSIICQIASGDTWIGQAGLPTHNQHGVIRVSANTKPRGAYVALGSRMMSGRASNGVIYDRLEDAGAKIFNTRSLAHSACLVANGKLAGSYIGVATPFETASIALIVSGAGGKITDLWGQPHQRFDQPIKGCIASNGLLHNYMVDCATP